MIPAFFLPYPLENSYIALPQNSLSFTLFGSLFSPPMQQEESGQGAKKENPCLHLLLSLAQLLFLNFWVFFFFF